MECNRSGNHSLSMTVVLFEISHVFQEHKMASPKTIELQKQKHVESKREWLWISTNIDYERGTKTKGLTYCKPKQKETT